MDSERVFLGVDWAAVESYLTAYHSKDQVLLSELLTQHAGGPKLHSLNAALLFNCDPDDAKTHMVNLKGRMRPAYDAGKRLSHLWNYGGGARMAARTFWLPEKFMATAFDKLADKYRGVTRWREQLADRVFGQPSFKCTRCGYVGDDDADCTDCTRAVGVPVPLRFNGYTVQPTRVERTAFGRHRLYEGRRRNGQNALASQHPQSCGASMWNITFARLHGWCPVNDQPWPSPDNILRYDPRDPWTALLRPAEITIATGTYDSFYLELPRSSQDEVLQWVLWTVEQPWPQLDNWRFPAEALIGRNLGKFHETINPQGLKDVTSIKPLTMAQDDGWH